MFGFVSASTFNDLVERFNEMEKDYKKVLKENEELKEKYGEDEVYSKEQRVEMHDSFNNRIKNIESDYEELEEDYNAITKVLQGREDALAKLAEDESVNDIEYFIRRDIKKFEDFKKEFIKDSESKLKRKLAEEKAVLQNKHLDEQKGLYTSTANLIFSPRMAGKALGNNNPNEVV